MPPAYTPDLNDPQMQTTHHAASVLHTANSQDPHPEAEDPDTRTDAEEATATTVIKKEKNVIQLLILLLGFHRICQSQFSMPCSMSLSSSQKTSWCTDRTWSQFFFTRLHFWSRRQTSLVSIPTLGSDTSRWFSFSPRNAQPRHDRTKAQKNVARLSWPPALG